MENKKEEKCGLCLQGATYCPHKNLTPPKQSWEEKIHNILQEEIAKEVWYQDKGCEKALDRALIRAEKEIASLLTTKEQEVLERKITEDTSDGYHTFKELYEFRLLYNAHLFNEWAEQGKYDVHKSKRHSDGNPCFDGTWFIVVAQLPTGQISNHYQMKDWELFKIPERPVGAVWDGHTPQDVATRLRLSLEDTQE